MDGLDGRQAAAALQEGDKRWVAVLAMDIVGFSSLTQTLGAEKVYDLLQEVLQIARVTIEKHGGHVVDTAGDGILAAFGAPAALENASLLTCRAADEIMTTLYARADNLAQRFGVAPQLRLGIAGGNVMVAYGPDRAVKLVGDPVNLAARLEALATPDTVLLTDTIQREVAGYVATDHPETVHLKGFADPVQVHRMGQILDTPTRFEGQRKRGLGAFVSRSTELQQALSVFDGSTDKTALLLSGVAGIGKSRLLFEVLDHIRPTHRPLVGQCAPDKTARPFAPIEMVIQSASGLSGTASLRDQIAAIRKQVPDSCDDAGIARYTLPRALELDPVGRVLHDRDFLEKVLTRVAAATKSVLVFEDVHWMDTATADLLAALVTSDTPLLVTTRDPDALTLPANVAHIALQPMADTDIGRIFAAQSIQPLAPALTTRVIHKAEGIPLIAEEIGHALRSSGKLQATDAGFDLKDASGGILSGNLQQLVLSRIDRLPPAQRKTLQIASAIGRDFSWPLLQNVVGEGAATPALDRFDGIIDALDARTGRFSHALIREAVYDGLLSGQRQDIHRRIAGALVAQDQPPDSANLADHYVQADMPEAATKALIQAGDEALQVYDLLQADRRLSQAFEYVCVAPEVLDDVTYARLCHLWMRALSINGNYRRILSVADRFLPRLTQSPYAPGSGTARALVALARTGGRDYTGARDLLLETIADAEAHGDTHGAAWAKSTLARVYDETNWEGPTATQALCQEILPIAEAAQDRLLAMTAQYLMVASLRACGRRVEALETANEIEALAEKYQDRRARGYANWARAVVFTVGGDPEAAARVLAVAKEDILPHTTDSRVIQGVEIFTQIYSEPPEVVRQRTDQMRARATELLDYNLIHSADWIRTVLELRAGHLAVGWRMADDLIPRFEKAGNINLLRQAHIMRAEVLLTIAGLIDPDSEAPDDRPKFARAKPKLADVLTFARLKFQAKRLARRELEICVHLDPQKRGAHFARAQIGLGLIAASMRQADRAKDHLQQGLDHASAEGIAVLCARAEAGLAKLA